MKGKTCLDTVGFVYNVKTWCLETCLKTCLGTLISDNACNFSSDIFVTYCESFTKAKFM